MISDTHRRMAVVRNFSQKLENKCIENFYLLLRLAIISAKPFLA